MTADYISEIGIDNIGRLFIKPRTQTFDYIYRAAVEVNWDNKEKCLFSPKPREWTYFMWYEHIIKTAKDEYSCNLYLAAETKWTNIPYQLKQQIKEGN